MIRPRRGAPRRGRIVARSPGPPAPDGLAGGEQHEGRWDAYVAPGRAARSPTLAGPEGLPWHDGPADPGRPRRRAGRRLRRGDLARRAWPSTRSGSSRRTAGPSLSTPWRSRTPRPRPSRPQADRRRAGAGAAPPGRGGAGAGRRGAAAIRRPFRAPSRARCRLHASAMLGRLLGGAGPRAAHESVAAFRSEIESTRPPPDRGLRRPAGHPPGHPRPLRRGSAWSPASSLIYLSRSPGRSTRRLVDDEGKSAPVCSEAARVVPVL